MSGGQETRLRSQSSSYFTYLVTERDVPRHRGPKNFQHFGHNEETLIETTHRTRNVRYPLVITHTNTHFHSPRRYEEQNTKVHLREDKEFPTITVNPTLVRNSIPCQEV